MFDTLVYIPLVLAYVFVSLLISILFFIVIFISHKIYLIICDNIDFDIQDDTENTKNYKKKLINPGMKISIKLTTTKTATETSDKTLTNDKKYMKY